MHFAHSIEIENKTGKTSGREIVAAVTDERRRNDTRSCDNCGKQGHLKIDCRSKRIFNKSTKNDGEVVLAANDHIENENDEWLLDSGASRLLMNEDCLLIDAETATMKSC